MQVQIALSLEEVNAIMVALSERPLKETVAVWASVKNQAEQQLQAAQQEQEEAEKAKAAPTKPAIVK